MVTAKELQYRTLSELIDAVRIDLRVWSGEGNIEVQELIKIAQMCNYELGLNLNQTKETILEIEHYRAKLPADFQFMNYALLCHHYNVVNPSIGNGIRTQDVVQYNISPASKNLTTCPCWTVVSQGAQVKVTHCDGVEENIYFPPNDDGSAKTTKVCAISLEKLGGGTFTYTTSSFCYNDPNTATYTCERPDDCGCSIVENVNTCAAIHPDPFNQNKVYTICDGRIGVKVMQICAYECREYTEFAPVYLTPSRQASAFSNPKLGNVEQLNQAQIKNGFLQFAIPCGTVYINYQGVMEDDEGNLLVLDHPKINDYYEFAMKKRILENLYINGEPDIERRLQYVSTEFQKAKIAAMTIVNTPDYRVMKETMQIIRNNSMEMFAAPISRFYGPYAWISFRDQMANGRFAE